MGWLGSRVLFQNMLKCIILFQNFSTCNGIERRGFADTWGHLSIILPVNRTSGRSFLPATLGDKMDSPPSLYISSQDDKCGEGVRSYTITI